MEEMIEKYLLGLLSKEDRKAFENELAQDENLAREVNLQRDIMEAAKLQGLKTDIHNAYKQVKLGKMLKTAFITAVAVLGLAIFYVAKTLKPKIDPTEVGASLPTSVFNIDNTKDTVIETTNGIILHIPAYAFGDVDYYDLGIKEALNALDIMESGLNTMSDSNLLATAGMFKITATKDGVELQLTNGKEITAQVPTDEIDPNIMLFDGVEDSTGNVNWVNPKKIKNYLVNCSFDELNFYPPGYLVKVAENGYDPTNKKFTDSLYWSFDCGVESAATNEENWERSYYEADVLNSLNRDAQIVEESNRITPQLWKIKLNPNPFKVGDIVTLQMISDQIDDGLIYSNGMAENCASNASLMLKRHRSFELVGGLTSMGAKEQVDEILGCKTFLFDKNAVFLQKIKILNMNLSLQGSLEYQKCNSKGNCVLFERSISLRGVTNQTDSAVTDQAEQPRPEICPASIQVLQSKRFAKTYIATKEFEQRLQHLFEICDETSLNVYIANLDRDICYADSIVASRMSGAKKEIFERFAAQKLGNTETASPAFAKLADYHKKKKNAYDEAARKAREKVLNKYAKEDATKQNQDRKKSVDEMQDRANVFEKELKTNLVEAYRQAGLSYPIPLAPKAMYIVPITTTGWKNLDQYVTASTISRTSLKTTYNNKDISIEYHKLKVEVQNEASYDFVNVYLIPNKLPSYQKMNKNNAVYTESLNELFDYELVCLAKKGSEYFVYTDLLQKKDDSKSVTLRSIDKKELKTLLKSMNKSTANRNVSDDLEYEEQNFLYNQNLKKRKKDEVFRREIEDVIWPCNLPRTSTPTAAPEAELF